MRPMLIPADAPTATCDARLVRPRDRRPRRMRDRARSATALVPCLASMAATACWLAGLAACSKTSREPGAAESGSAVARQAEPPPPVAPSASASALPMSSDEDCRKARACVDFGACTSRDGRCAATSSEDCARSEWCKRVGNCAAHDGQCVVAATTDAACRSKHGEAGKDLCANEGLCTARDGVCEAATAEDCQKSELCLNRAACTPKDGRCALTSEADCRQSLGCKASGLCKYQETRGTGRCVPEKSTQEGDGHQH